MTRIEYHTIQHNNISRVICESIRSSFPKLQIFLSAAATNTILVFKDQRAEKIWTIEYDDAIGQMIEFYSFNGTNGKQSLLKVGLQDPACLDIIKEQIAKHVDV